ncbi:MAG: CARDB domain-containing protein [Nanoarchaeota archaeon]|nr:CARDB domain-containing protein [Nanoarchaeota archaeon]
MAAIDLQITPPNITFSSSTPIEGEDIFINATFSNAGNQNASNVLVRFFDDSIPIGNITADVPAFSSTSVTQFWKAEIGPNTIKAILDPNNVIPETNENNNNVSKEISIAAYHTYFGKSLAITALGIGVDSLFKKEAAGCNVLVVDSDSNVDFSSLQAIGRRENGIPTLNDFIDVDTVLNMTAFNDSIASVWTLYGNFPNFPIFKAIPKKVETFTVFGQTIANVSIINSTNTTTFRTGILWDTSDNTPVFNRQFDATDREDLVFITKINQSKQGKFGVYDYEIKVPALLRDYKPGSSTIDFFLDMDSICS